MENVAVATLPHLSAQHARAKFGMWVFLASEVMFFTGFFGAYIVLRSANPTVFEQDFSVLSVPLAAVNTLFLIASSLTMALAVFNAQHGDRERVGNFLMATIMLGCGFMVIKTIEYGTKFSHNIFPSTSVPYALYFTLTGFHGLHVFAGILALLVLWGRAQAKAAATDMGSACELVGLYWHLVDLIWIFLFPLIYLLKFP
ncbi:MAG: cytochrome c oxidase subunit 3 [Planctomycetes bacterium]|nr:cytochrome c oxidase subunit 3 [Planctomycetota bacterium]